MLSACFFIGCFSSIGMSIKSELLDFAFLMFAFYVIVPCPISSSAYELFCLFFFNYLYFKFAYSISLSLFLVPAFYYFDRSLIFPFSIYYASCSSRLRESIFVSFPVFLLNLSSLSTGTPSATIMPSFPIDSLWYFSLFIYFNFPSWTGINY